MRGVGRIGSVAAAVVATAVLAGCGSSGDSSSSAATSAGATAAQSQGGGHGRACTADDVKVDGGFGATPKITLPDSCDPPTGLVTKDLVAGSGPGAEAGQQLLMNYSLVTWSDKQKLDSSFDRGQPFPLTLGAGMVIQGWDQGLAGIQKGTRRLLIVPPQLGYGQGGNGVKPNETLVFVTDAVQVGS
ncbi:FKBP-type peptidyl-prolyl cis-trans isomerase [Nocardia sp. BMG111209]|uniref:FKBP-type peptidyl-prolyl cis-trans isomerase n=1 Tax=Nocardia sp. BMG111209 TaxID=1160137 RepID=UPI0003A41F5D|nr:FKBP-type peptidyl-prolyl cis-trans isomerase [Nocardia sp. BMG111209]